jgi:hypothetical protein
MNNARVFQILVGVNLLSIIVTLDALKQQNFTEFRIRLLFSIFFMMYAIVILVRLYHQEMDTIDEEKRRVEFRRNKASYDDRFKEHQNKLEELDDHV